ISPKPRPKWKGPPGNTEMVFVFLHAVQLCGTSRVGLGIWMESTELVGLNRHLVSGVFRLTTAQVCVPVLINGIDENTVAELLAGMITFWMSSKAPSVAAPPGMFQKVTLVLTSYSESL